MPLGLEDLELEVRIREGRHAQDIGGQTLMSREYKYRCETPRAPALKKRWRWHFPYIRTSWKEIPIANTASILPTKRNSKSKFQSMRAPKKSIQPNLTNYSQSLA